MVSSNGVAAFLLNREDLTKGMVVVVLDHFGKPRQATVTKVDGDSAQAEVIGTFDTLCLKWDEEYDSPRSRGWHCTGGGGVGSRGAALMIMRRLGVPIPESYPESSEWLQTHPKERNELEDIEEIIKKFGRSRE